MPQKISAYEIYQKYYSNISEKNFKKIVSADTVSSNLQRENLTPDPSPKERGSGERSEAISPRWGD
jgi:hypothetical protein